MTKEERMNMQDHSHIGSDSTFRDGWIQGAARAFFVSAYADHCEEADSTDNDLTEDERKERSSLPRPGAGGDWDDYAPETPPNAYALAGELWAMLEHENGCSVYVLANHAAAADNPCQRCRGRGQACKLPGVMSAYFEECEECNGRGSTSEVDSEEFGSDLAMQAMGHGVSWFDDHKRFELKVPHVECNQCTFDANAYAEDES